ncbi:hypothetical protein [Rhodanobacter lindaniclasticus]
MSATIHLTGAVRDCGLAGLAVLQQQEVAGQQALSEATRALSWQMAM